MKKLIHLGLISLALCSFAWAEEYISSEYYEEIISQPEIIYELDESTIITEMNESLEYIEPTEMLEHIEYVDTEVVAVEDAPRVELSPYLKALETAKNEGKVIMLAIRSTDCKYCDEMEVETLSESSVKDAIERDFVTVHYNQDLEPLPLGLQEGMTPTFIFVNTTEDILNMYPGMRSPKEFKEVLEQILAM